ncbi:MAG: hypothetical protein EB140_10000, partial [Proteobacteria bacterium]|nr:hypothetical protein [Pseudomonadota bacterium]
FAMVLVDTEKQRMYVARDPYGVRPLYEGTFPTGERWEIFPRRGSVSSGPTT